MTDWRELLDEVLVVQAWFTRNRMFFKNRPQTAARCAARLAAKRAELVEAIEEAILKAKGPPGMGTARWGSTASTDDAT